MLLNNIRNTFNTSLARNFGANEKLLKIRMSAVKNIRKITKAMKMVATAKMRHDVNRLNNGKNFGVSVVPTILANDQYMASKVTDVQTESTLVVPFTTDKGLCGGVNGFIVRGVRDMINASDRSKYKILPIGDKGSSGLARQFNDLVANSITEVEYPVNFYNAAAISSFIINYPGNHNEILFVYNHFKNQMSQIQKYVPVMTRGRFLNQFKHLVKYEAEEPEAEYSANYFYELYVSSQVYHCLLNSAACEQSSRMNAMGNASNNAGDILAGLTLKYNQARQARITMELIEIISGANAL